MRIPYPDPDTLSPTKREVWETSGDTMLNVSRTLMHMPDALWAAQRALARATIYDLTIGDEDRELAILRIGYLLDSEYELHHHLSIAAAMGIPQSACEAMRTGDFSALTDRQATLARFVTELVEDVRPSDGALAAMRAVFSDPQIFEVLAVVGYYMMVARVLATTGVPLDAAPVAAWPRRQG